MELPLFESERICLGPMDLEKDPEIEARWSNDSDYLRMLSVDPARPVSVDQIKKRYEKIEKEQEEKNNQFHFAVRMRTDDRLVGFVRLFWIEWNNGTARIQMGIGDAQDRGCGYGREVLNLALRFAFSELNFYRLMAVIPEYNQAAQRLFSGAGFTEEVRRREAAARDGRRWDVMLWGILHNEWRG